MKFKIVSNPYAREIRFFTAQDDEFCEVNYNNNSSSRLLSEDLKTGFFPFKVKEILEILIDEYYAADYIELIFEGTDDEYLEIKAVCEGYADKLTLTRSEYYLENARDVLPDIAEIVNDKIKPLVMQSSRGFEAVKLELDRYAEASNDIIPIAVLGNYSSGKSSFINALIGSEILPSGTEPVTARIYKISASPFPDRGHVAYNYGGEDTKLKFTSSGFKFGYGTVENPFTAALREALETLGEGATVSELTGVAVSTINEYEDDRLSSLVEIEIPFAPSPLSESLRRFVIFDCPGSNSASNKEHFCILKRALEGFSNGLTIYVSEFDSLDTTDNQSLFNEIKSISALDHRFNLIVINKCDSAELDKGGFSSLKQKRILEQAVPRNLYSWGMFFVSSIIGLGAKTKGEFKDDYYAEIFEEKRLKFSDRDSRFFRSLPCYNIMPKQLKAHNERALEESHDELLKNSGILAVEEEIKKFGNIYSSYNKATQSLLFLERITDMTFDEIKFASEERENSRAARNESLSRDKKQLIAALDELKESAVSEYKADYGSLIDELSRNSKSLLLKDELSGKADELQTEIKATAEFDLKKGEVDSAANRLFSALREGIIKTAREHNIKSLESLGHGLSENLGALIRNIQTLSATSKEIDADLCEALILKMNEEFDLNFDKKRDELEKASREFWKRSAADYKNRLVSLISGSSSISEEKRGELEKVILTYGEIPVSASDPFMLEEFKLGVKIGGWKIYDANRLNLQKLLRRYNLEMKKSLEAVLEKIVLTHTGSFDIWRENLLDAVIERLTEYNPTLRSQAQIIKEESEKISELENRRKKLATYTKAVKSLMQWKKI